MEQRIKKIILILRQQTKNFSRPLIDTIIDEYGKKPFLILVGCLLSLRAKDKVTIHACRNLFKKAQTPQELLSIPQAELEKIIYTTGCYKKKAKVLHEVAEIIHNTYNDEVPHSSEKLSAIKGLGNKTVNLVLGLAYNIPSICVDTHVHRISNRLGLVKTSTPLKTELPLMKVVPKKYWIEINTLLVIWGQNICLPRGPKCSQCAISGQCDFYNKK